jgi:hypothetical protein
MRWQSETRTQTQEREAEWHQWFAWYPVKDREHGYRMWLETVLRRAQPHRRWSYRPITILETDLKSQATIDAEETVDVPDLYGMSPGHTTRVVRRKKLPSQ